MTRLFFSFVLTALLCGSALAANWHSTLPDWVNRLPSGDKYQYFRGEGVDAHQERAKTKARADAVRKAVIWQEGITTGAMVDEVRISGQVESILSQLSVAAPGTRLRDIEWIDDHGEADEVSEARPLVDVHGNTVRDSWGMPVTQGVAVSKTYHYWVLIRLPKQQPGPVGVVARGVGRRIDAVFHSALYPGWGQFRQQRETEGTIYALAGTAFLAGAVYAQIGIETYDRNNRQPGKTSPSLEDWRRYRNAALGGFVLVYGVNLVDALVFGRQSEEYRGLSLKAGPQGVGLVVAMVEF
jgi:hypothetical protein